MSGLMECPPDRYDHITDVPWLVGRHIHVANPEKVMEKVRTIIKDGKNKLQVIFDFDRTLTKEHENGIQTKSTFCVLEMFPNAPAGFQEKSRESLAKYRPIEIDPLMTIEEKLPFMLQWWEEGIQLLKGIDWDPVVVDEYLRQNQQPFRVGTDDCFKELYHANIPVLVFSAGLGDVVKSLMKHANLLTPNVHIVSNFFKIVDGKVEDYQNDVIHVFNKNECQIKNTPYHSELEGRTNVILLGDSLGDAGMADSVHHDTILKIGFLSSNSEESLPLYMDMFDIVLVDDQTMSVLLNLLKRAIY